MVLAWYARLCHGWMDGWAETQESIEEARKKKQKQRKKGALTQKAKGGRRGVSVITTFQGTH